MSKPRSRIDKLIYGTSHVGRTPVNRDPTTVQISVVNYDNGLSTALTLKGTLVQLDRSFDSTTGLTELRVKMWVLP